MLQKASGAPMTHVPYRGGAPAHSSAAAVSLSVHDRALSLEDEKLRGILLKRGIQELYEKLERFIRRE
jgi:hypothetical protein